MSVTTSTTPQRPRRRKKRSKAEKEERRNAFRAMALRLRGELDEGKHKQKLTIVKRNPSLTGLQRYSELNQLMILEQYPAATEVHGYVEWQTLGKQVPEGVDGIAIRAPHDLKKDAEATNGRKDGGDDEGKEKGFHFTYVWDISQVIDADPKKEGEAKTKTTGQQDSEQPTLSVGEEEEMEASATDYQESSPQQEEQQPQEEEAAPIGTADHIS